MVERVPLRVRRKKAKSTCIQDRLEERVVSFLHEPKWSWSPTWEGELCWSHTTCALKLTSAARFCEASNGKPRPPRHWHRSPSKKMFWQCLALGSSTSSKSFRALKEIPTTATGFPGPKISKFRRAKLSEIEIRRPGFPAPPYLPGAANFWDGP